MTYSNDHPQEYLSKDNQSLSNELKLKLSDAFKRITMLEKELQDKQGLILNLQEQLHLKQPSKSNGRD